MNDNVIKMTKTRQTRLLSYMSPSNGFWTRQSSKNKSIYRSLELKQLRMGVQLISKPHKANSFSFKGSGIRSSSLPSAMVMKTLIISWYQDWAVCWTHFSHWGLRQGIILPLAKRRKSRYIWLHTRQIKKEHLFLL